MATLKDVQYSLNGEAQGGQKRNGKDISGLVEYESKKLPKIDKEWLIFKLVNSSTKGGVYLPSIDDVVNPETGKVERIRLLSGVDSIWQKDQKDITPEYARKNLREISFPRGIKIRRVKNTDATMIEFLRLTNANIGNKNRISASRFEIYEYDSAAAEKEAFEKEDFELEVALLAKQEKLENMKKHAAFLGIRLINDIGEPKSEDGIRREYVIYAKRNPHYFKQTMNTEQIALSWLVRKAIADALIDIGREPGKVFWSKGGGMICVMPPNSNAQDYLTELAMTNSEEGKNFKEQLQKIVT